LSARPDGSLTVFGHTNSPEFGNPADPPPSRDFSQMFVRTTDTLCTMFCRFPRRLFSPTRHLTLDVVVQKGAHLYLVGDAVDRDPTGRWLGYRGHYLKRWHVGRAADEGNAPEGGRRRTHSSPAPLAGPVSRGLGIPSFFIRFSGEVQLLGGRRELPQRHLAHHANT
jgi:hypothetical protein